MDIMNADKIEFGRLGNLDRRGLGSYKTKRKTVFWVAINKECILNSPFLVGAE